MSIERITSRVAALAVIVAAAMLFAHPRAQARLAGPAYDAFDQMLDRYVREGLVYYRAVQVERASLDRFIGEIADVSLTDVARDDRLAFWLNAYNALVLRTVIDRYPINGHSTQYPSGSIRQIPGAFEQVEHRVAGQTLTLDQMERTELAAFGDPRVYLALGRGAVGGGRLRSAAFTGDELERQLSEVRAECLRRSECVQVDRANTQVVASSIFSWRSAEFVAAYADNSDPLFVNRSPVERAVLAYIAPHLLPAERELVKRNQFELRFSPFDWRLNDLTGR